MGYSSFEKLSIAQLSKHIRSRSKESGAIYFSVHAKARMGERKITTHQVFECLRMGNISRTPEPNDSKGSLECRMERYVAGKNLGVMVALCDEDPELLVVTVLYVV